MNNFGPIKQRITEKLDKKELPSIKTALINYLAHEGLDPATASMTVAILPQVLPYL